MTFARRNLTIRSLAIAIATSLLAIFTPMASAQTAGDPQAPPEEMAGVISHPTQPFPDLPAEQQQYLEQVLDYWQQTSNQVKRYECDFHRWEYDSDLVNYRDPQTQQLAAAVKAAGTIRFAGPDKARYETTAAYKFAGPDKEYELIDEEISLERWITDGSHIYEFDFENKKIYETAIPPEMRGPGGLDRSPIPFLFGADKAKILKRYWVRVITPKGTEDEYWLEAFPKRAEDAQNYSRLEIILAKEDFLPKALHMYSPQYDPSKNDFGARHFTFQNRKVNSGIAVVKDFLGVFVRPQLPIGQGWKWVPRMVPGNSQADANPDELR